LRSLIPENVNKKLDEIVTMCFLGNRIADRAMSVMDVKFSMNKSSELLHQKLAHLFPLIGDIASSYQSARNCLTFYGDTPADGTDYNSPQEFFEKLLDYMTDLESLCYESCQLAKEESDFTTSAFLHKFIRMLIPITNQCILLADKGKAYNGDWMRFDHDVDDFVILGEFNKGWVK